MIHFHHVSYTYPEAARPVLCDLSFSLPPGSLTLVIGPSGCGKSTLLRCLNGLTPHFSGGELRGQVRVAGCDPVALGPQGMSRRVGFVFQDPEAQFITDGVEDEVAFALENAAVPRAEMRARVTEALERLGLAALRRRAVTTLSGGEKQRVAIAAALALRPQVLVLDEPTSQLDPTSAAEVLRFLEQLNRQLGLTLVLSEHRLERVLPFADWMLALLPDGAVRVDAPRALLRRLPPPLLPPVTRLGLALGLDPLPLTVADLAECVPQPEQAAPVTAISTPQTPPLVEAVALTVQLGGRSVLHGVSLALYPGEIVALIGANGAGKTTLLRALVGLVRAQSGEVRLRGRSIAGLDVADICRQAAYLPQDPNALLFADTLQEELAITLRNHGLPLIEAQARALLEHLGLSAHAHAYPRDLSVGERQRAALGAVAITGPEALLLDEPTRGLDYAAKQQLSGLLRGWRAAGMAILLTTHDVELVAENADRVVWLEAGQVRAVGAPQEVLRTAPGFAPQIAQAFPASGWLTVEAALAGLSAT